MILEREWRNLLEDAREKRMRKEGNMMPSGGRYMIYLIECVEFSLVTHKSYDI